MSDINAERTVFRVRCPVCSGTHLFPDAGVDLDANPLLARRLCVDLHERLHQELLDAEATLKEVETKEDLAALEMAFIEAAKSYSERKGISYTAWRQVGVPARVLKAAGVPRTRQR